MGEGAMTVDQALGGLAVLFFIVLLVLYFSARPR